MAIALKTVKRKNLRRSYLKELRKQGYVPGIVYGKELEGTPIEIEKGDLTQAIRKGGRHAIVQLKLGDQQKIDCMIHEIQVDPIDRNILHADFRQISMDEEVNTTVPIRLVGTPAGVQDGGIVEQQLEELHIRCLPKDIPAFLEVNIEALHIGDVLRVSDLTMPQGVTINQNQDEVILTIVPPKLDPVQEEETPKVPEMVETSDDAENDAAK